MRYKIEYLVGVDRHTVEVEAPDELTALFRAGYEAGIHGNTNGFDARVISFSSPS